MDQKVDANHLENMSMAMHVARDWFLQALSFLLFVLARWIVVTLQKFTWAVTGVERIRRDAKRGLQFKQSAHVLDVLWKRKCIACSVADINDFITTHHGFKHPSYVWRQAVSLYCITRQEAVFIETADGEDVYIGGPLYMRQFTLAQRIITMPLASFHKTASDIGMPHVPLTWLSCTPRSGSTLLAHVLGSTPNMRVLHEPDVLTCLGKLQKDGTLAAGEYTQLLASAIRLLCKPDDRCGSLLIKVRPCITRMIEDVYPEFPRARYLFLYRNSLKTLNSCLAVAADDPATRALRMILDSHVLSTILPYSRKTLYSEFVGINEKPNAALRPSQLSTCSILITAWAASVSCCSELRDKGVPMCVLLYEDIMRNPRSACHVLFKLLELRPEHVSQALQVFRLDFNRSPVMTHADTRRALPHEARQEADSILKKYGLPRLGERIELPGLVKFD